MNRRDLLKLITAATGAAFVGTNPLAYELRPDVALADTGFTKDDVAFLNEVGEVIIPRTDTPGAKDSNVGQIMAVLVADCYPSVLRKTFRDGMKKLDAEATSEFGKVFLLLDKSQRHSLISRLDEEAREYNHKKGLWSVASQLPNQRREASQAPVPHYFSLFKQLTLFGFFTSKEGGTKVLRYVPVPGKYDGNIEYKKGQKAWAT